MGENQEAMAIVARPKQISGGRSNVLIVLICALLAAVIFIVDIVSLPLGVAAGVPYVAVVLIALWLPKWQHLLIVAAGVSVLTAVGYLLSEPAGIPWMVVTNRLLALAVIWFTAIAGSWLVLTKRKKSEVELRKVEQEADDARNAKTRFLETAGNDIRHYLQTLSLLHGALRKTVTNAKAQEMFAMQGDALGQLADLMNSLLEISEFESGEVELKITNIPIQDIFQQIQDEYEYQAKAKGLQLEFNSQSEVALSDGALLTRIFRILVSNAIRYTNQGEVKVYCHREPAGLRITVQDSGIGIAADQLTRIFDEFYRVENDPAGRNVGLGLGLAIVERSVKLLGTKMDVKSEPGRGSSFSLLVPAAP